jgi:hypothetical protein
VGLRVGGLRLRFSDLGLGVYYLGFQVKDFGHRVRISRA